MRGHDRYLIVAMALAATLIAPALAGAAGELGQDKFKPGDKAPELVKAAFLDGKEPKLADLAGKRVLLLNFWGLRCGACLEEMPYLDDIWKRYADKGLTVWGVDTDGVDAQTVRDTLKEVQVSVGYPLIVDPDFTVTDAYTNFLVPLTLIIDKTGVIRYIHTGFEKGREKEYEEAVKKALGS
jgi:peroxiredoxin